MSAWSSAGWDHLSACVAEIERRAASLRQDMERLGPAGMSKSELRRRLSGEPGGIEDVLLDMGPAWWESEPCHTSD